MPGRSRYVPVALRPTTAKVRYCTCCGKYRGRFKHCPELKRRRRAAYAQDCLPT